MKIKGGRKIENWLLIRYPILVKHKWLLPFYEVKRWFSMLIQFKSNKAINELQVNAETGVEKCKAMESLLKQIGLDLI